MALLAFVGLAVSAELTHIHYRTHTDPTFRSVCAVSAKVNCETVAQSPYSVFLGVPVSVWGLLGYSVLALLSLWGLSAKRLHRGWPRGALLALTAVFCLVSAILGTISVTKIDSICLFCFSTYGINAALLVLAFLAAARTESGPLMAVMGDLRAAAQRPVGPALLCLAGLCSVAALLIAYPQYFHNVGWNDLPRLVSGSTEEGHHWIGATKPKLIIEEFSDYECPHCRKAHKQVRDLSARYRDQVRLMHRHFPLDNACNPIIPTPFHERACEFALAAECAAEQGKFWEMNDALFSVQEAIKAKDVDIRRLCVQIGLDSPRFNTCLESGAMKGKVASDIADGSAHGLSGTPTFYINDEPFVGFVPQEILEARLGKPPGASVSRP
jgi:protein-disulfide isomerase/uncharacterized membrane protein